MQVDHPKEKCQNPNCGCEMEAGRPYCSEHCRNVAELSGSKDQVAEGDNKTCACGHDECTDGQ